MKILIYSITIISISPLFLCENKSKKENCFIGHWEYNLIYITSGDPYDNSNKYYHEEKSNLIISENKTFEEHFEHIRHSANPKSSVRRRGFWYFLTIL